MPSVFNFSIQIFLFFYFCVIVCLFPMVALCNYFKNILRFLIDPLVKFIVFPFTLSTAYISAEYCGSDPVLNVCFSNIHTYLELLLIDEYNLLYRTRQSFRLANCEQLYSMQHIHMFLSLVHLFLIVFLRQILNYFIIIFFYYKAFFIYNI